VTAKITVGVIGCGYWGPNLLRNFAENESCELRWICDLDQQRLDTLRRRYPAVQTTTDYRRLLADPLLDAVAIVTPVWTHFQFAREALVSVSTCW
jgi:predicted dehydrogenase